MSTERELFEAWAVTESFNIDRHYDDAGGEYHRATTRWAWRAWQAARSADTSGARWVSVDERFPNGREVILVAVSWIRHYEHEDGTPAEVAGYDVTEGQYVPKHGEGDGYFESFQGAHGDSYGVTHWMPLPEPPPAAPGGPAGARRPDENSPSGPSDRALNPQPEAVDHDRGAQ